jgi:DinB superfamily
MKRLLVALLFATSVFAADPVPTATDNQKIVKELERTQTRLLTAIDGLSEAQWNFKPAPDKWSVAECVEHITAAEPMIRGMIAAAMKKEATAEMITAGIRKDDLLSKGMTDRSKKFNAPEPLIPTNRFGTPAAAVEAYNKERGETIKLAASDVDLRTHADNHFLFGPLDAYGWFLFLSGHSERHTLQIEEVKAHPDFPKK